MMREMIKADEVEYEPIFFDWQDGRWVHPRKLKRKWYVRVGGYYVTGKTKKAAYKKAKKLYDERNIEK